MPRQPRLDAPETLHHVMVRGLERRVIFRDDRDRDDFVTRFAALAEGGALMVYAWALLPNHAHLLVRTGARPLARNMRSLLTGYAESGDVNQGTRPSFRCQGKILLSMQNGLRIWPVPSAGLPRGRSVVTSHAPS